MEDEESYCLVCGMALLPGELDDFGGLCYSCFIGEDEEDDVHNVWKGVWNDGEGL